MTNFRYWRVNNINKSILYNAALKLSISYKYIICQSQENAFTQKIARHEHF